MREPDIAWNRVTGFHLDEYVGLPIAHPASFRGYLWQRFVSRLPLPLAAFHFLDGEGDPQAECRRVGEIIRRHPIDVAFVGIGENGHLAFNDPPADFETEEPYLVVELDDACRRQQLGEGWFPTFDDVPQQAISMSVRQIMKSRAIICTVPDERKAEAVRNAVEGEVTPQVPASILQRHKLSRCSWISRRLRNSAMHRRIDECGYWIPSRIFSSLKVVGVGCVEAARHTRIWHNWCVSPSLDTPYCSTKHRQTMSAATMGDHEASAERA